ncbi:MAG: hypothetical protein HY730_06975 [Candidatus Tectomicrobia bacterium]|uniref:Uncharacterized protein n=1 Tax=Tectimicrobiota bacterium TaxID=2528274 RepID=A0A933GLJ4_UNCTE|nr:hypothetical protein [Candidatus Tectomicrobia bacterium]
MNEEIQRRKIIKFLKGKINKDIDVFCVYQWIDRCHFHGWWDLGMKLSPSVPPNSLDKHYHQRLDFLIRECRSNYDAAILAKQSVIQEKMNLRNYLKFLVILRATKNSL